MRFEYKNGVMRIEDSEGRRWQLDGSERPPIGFELDSPDKLSILIYLGEDTTGDLFLYDKSDRTLPLDEIAFRPNRVIAFDGSIPHQAFAPKDEKFRMSLIIRGKYRCGAFQPADVQRSS